MQPEDLVSATELGEWLDLHERQVRKLAERNVITRNGRGRYPLRQSIRAVAIHQREIAAGRAAEVDGEGLDLVAERARLASEQADAQAMKNAASRAETITMTQAENVWGAVVDATRTRILAVPTRAAPVLIGLKTEREVFGALTALLHEALDELSNVEIVAPEAEVARHA
jgi:phage terminase Nu1 subunit (DNA packaging protein)